MIVALYSVFRPLGVHQVSRHDCEDDWGLMKTGFIRGVDLEKTFFLEENRNDSNLGGGRECPERLWPGFIGF